jgi:hypothetical protein
MKFCPTCGKPVHRTDKKILVSLVNQEERVKHSYSCEDERHECAIFTQEDIRTWIPK